MDNPQSALQMRLLSCLQTIIEMEDDLAAMELGHDLLKEFKILKSVMERIDRIQPSEQDVLRVEKATAYFLEELRGPLQDILKTRRSSLLQ